MGIIHGKKHCLIDWLRLNSFIVLFVNEQPESEDNNLLVVIKKNLNNKKLVLDYFELPQTDSPSTPSGTSQAHWLPQTP